MNFTREPIIETIITPKDGFRLTVRSSKGQSQEEYSVEALEVVSFGNALFFRSSEKPRSFLLPITDYEIIESREPKIVLKNPTIDKTIKIAGGREPNLKPVIKEAVHQEVIETAQEETEEEKEQVFEKRKDKKKNRRKKTHELRNAEKEPEQKHEEKTSEEVVIQKKEAPAEYNGPSLFTSLLPPPTTLISETIGRYKSMESSANFMMSKNEEPQIELSQEMEISEYVDSGEDVLDQIWAQKQSEETFVSSDETKKDFTLDLSTESSLEETQEEDYSAEPAVIEVELEEEKSAEMDIDKFIE